MHQVSQQLIDTLEQDVSLNVYARVIAEWEINSYSRPAVTGASVDEDMFPVESVVLPRRPIRTGLPKAIANQSRATDPGTRPRYRTPSADNAYKYYHSAAVSNASWLVDDAIEIMYDEPIPVNKFVAGYEVSYSRPTSVEVSYHDGSNWVLAGNFVPDADGRVNLYLQESGLWRPVEDLHGGHIMTHGWRAKVATLDGPGVGVGVIQLSPRLVQDLTDRVINVSISRMREEYELTHPIGTAASSTANIELDNTDRFFDVEGSSVIAPFIDRNVQFNITEVVVRSDGVPEGVPQGVFFSDEWSASSDGIAQVNCTDRSKFLQEEMIENSFYWNLPAEHIVADIIERFGHTDYETRTAPGDGNRPIPYVFFKNNETVWDALRSLSLAEQSAFYFDEQDRFVWESRDWVWNNLNPVWEVRNTLNGNKLPNVIEWSPQYELLANKVNVAYTPLEPVTDIEQPVNNVVWELTDPTVMVSAPLLQSISANATSLRVPADNFVLFPDEGLLNVDGEFMRYEKGTGNTLNLTERGLYGSPVKSHNINPLSNFWSFYTARATGSGYIAQPGNTTYGRHQIRNSRLELTAPAFTNANTKSMFIGGTSNDNYAMYGCEVMFPASMNQNEEPYYNGEGVAGLFIHGNGVHDGYYFELMTTQHAVSFDRRRAELRCYRGNSDSRTFLPQTGSTELYPAGGRQIDIVPGRRYRLEVVARRQADVNGFQVFIDGVHVLSFEDTAPGSKRNAGRWGVFARGNTPKVYFEAVWAIDRNNVESDIASVIEQITDRTTGGFNSGTLESAWRKYNRRYGDVIYEDFGPWVFQGSEFDVNYDIAPNVASRIFMSNDDRFFTIYHESDPFRSQMAIMSRHRDPAVLVGTDPTRENTSVSFFIYGRPIVEGDDNNYEVEDELSVLRRGSEELELSSPWIQTKSRARRIADWIVQRWGNVNDIVEANTIIFTPLQVGDCIAVNMPSENMTPSTHRYHVVGITKSIGSHPSCTLILRRAR